MIAQMLTAVVLMLALGVRHGVDPEHIAIVNAVTLRAAERRRPWPAACGLWFALGHGLVITVVAMAVVGLFDAVHMPAWVRAVGIWLPAAILLAVAVANQRELLCVRRDYRPASIKRRLLPRFLRDASSAPAVFLIGMLFAPFVDPASQAAVWGYVVGSGASFAWVALLGLLLTAAMAATCTLEAWAVVRLMQGDHTVAMARRRMVGWLVVWFSFLVVGYTVATAWLPHADWTLHLPLAVVVGVALAGASAGIILALRLRVPQRA